MMDIGTEFSAQKQIKIIGLYFATKSPVLHILQNEDTIFLLKTPYSYLAL